MDWTVEVSIFMLSFLIREKCLESGLLSHSCAALILLLLKYAEKRDELLTFNLGYFEQHRIGMGRWMQQYGMWR